MQGMDVLGLVQGSIARGQVKRARIDVNGPNACLGGLQTHGDGQRTPAAAHIKEVTAFGEGGGLGKKLASPQINTRTRKDSVAHPHLQIEAANSIANQVKLIS